MDSKNVLYNAVKELSVTLEEIRFKVKLDKFITKKMNEIMDQKKIWEMMFLQYLTVYCFTEIGW